ncbi:3TM-type holin [Afipia sp. P52-10]|jgi:hypothetical protein|uniref:3TM-type holin n=1 Tax=Afipia sp. P52-10 TaxID=1429916 RepID=UPI0009DD3CED|nr:3TM-type holin [Afipia sp. P52-10]
MNWNDVARQVIGLGAPFLGNALGGPLGGAAGRILAEALGAPAATPGGVSEVLPSANPEKILEAENRWIEMIRAEADAQRTAISETHQTIRAELISNDFVQRWWRPIYAFELTLECAALWAVVVHEFWTGDVQTINALVNAMALLIAYWGFRFGVLGVYVSGRTREKLCEVTGREADSGAVGKLVKAITRRK